jgi:DNA topoisomerase-1
MSKNLVIVESPSKAKTIAKYLGKDFIVEASVGHIIDLPSKKLGVNLENDFEPEFVTISGKEQIINMLKKYSKTVDNIYIATDPDREGEAIAWHIENAIKEVNSSIFRVEFNEITKTSVKKAIESPRKIETGKVFSQQARRVLDRIVGYKVSPFLWKSIYKGLSAGRVQSVAVRLVCEREDEIDVFVPEEFWTISADFSTDKKEQIISKLEKIDNKKAKIANSDEAHAHVDAIKSSHFSISKVEKKTVKKSPTPPFTTSTLQQEAVRKLGMTSKRVMRTAQSLYEGVDLGGKGTVGLITYMRTDSVRISSEASEAARNLILSSYGDEFYPAKPRFFKTKKSAQDAHEAIRPTTIETDFSPISLKSQLTNDQFRLYQLIWNKFIASQMADAKIDKTVVEISDNKYLFRSRGETVVFKGFLHVYQIQKENDDANNPIPKGLKTDEAVSLEKIDPKQNFTKAPARYTESTIIKTLDELGIGRPSTYAQIISTILDRKYVESKEKKLFATSIGMTVNKALITHFPDIFNVKFTAKMEDQLDLIESEDLKYSRVLADFYSPFSEDLEKANSKTKEIKASLQEETDIVCDVCKKHKMIKKMSRNGKFLACGGFPECKNTKPLDEDGNPVSNEPVFTDHICENDGARMVLKKGPYGDYLECENYPECKTRKPVPTGAKCPKCNGDIIPRKSKRGKQFYGCSNFPNCDFMAWNDIQNEKCPNCENNYLEKRNTKAKGEHLYCPKCKNTVNG